MESKDLAEIRILGQLQYTPEQVRKIMGLDEIQQLELIGDDQSGLYQNYWAGFYETDIRLRKSVIDLATKGSSPAQSMLRKIIEEAETRRHYEQQ